MSARRASMGRAPATRPSRCAHVAHESGPGGEHLRAESGLLQPGLDGRGGTELLVAELGVHVQISPEGDQLGPQRVGQCAGQGGTLGQIGIGLAGHQLVHLLKSRPLAPSTDHRSTKVQPHRGTKCGAGACGMRGRWVNSPVFTRWRSWRPVREPPTGPGAASPSTLRRHARTARMRRTPERWPGWAGARRPRGAAPYRGAAYSADRAPPAQTVRPGSTCR